MADNQIMIDILCNSRGFDLFIKDLEGTNKKIKEYMDSLNSATATQNAFAQSTGNVQTEEERLTAALNKTVKSSKERDQTIKNTTQTLNKYGEVSGYVTKQTQKHTDALGNVTSVTGTLEKQVRNSAGAWSGVFSPAVQKNIDNMNNLRWAMVNFTFALAGIAALLSPFYLLIKAGVEWELQLKKIASISGEAFKTPQSMKDLSNYLITTRMGTPFTGAEMGTAFLEYEKAGFTAKQTMEDLPAVSNLAIAGFTDLATATNIVSTMMHEFAIDGMTASRVSDVIAKAANKSALGVDTFGNAMSYVGPIAAQLGFSLEETSAAMIVLSNSGLGASRSGTTLRQVLTQLSAPSREAQQWMDNLGISMYNADGSAKDLSEVFQSIYVGLERLDPAKKAKALADMFNIRGATGVAAVMNALRDGMNLKDIENDLKEVGYAQKIANEQMEASANRLKDALGNLQDSFKQVALGFNSAFSFIIEAANKALEAFNKLNVSTGGVASGTLVAGGTTAAIVAGVAIYNKLKRGDSVALPMYTFETNPTMVGGKSLLAEGGILTAIKSLIFNPATLTAAISMGIILGLASVEGKKNQAALEEGKLPSSMMPEYWEVKKNPKTGKNEAKPRTTYTQEEWDKIYGPDVSWWNKPLFNVPSRPETPKKVDLYKGLEQFLPNGGKPLPMSWLPGESPEEKKLQADKKALIDSAEININAIEKALQAEIDKTTPIWASLNEKLYAGDPTTGLGMLAEAQLPKDILDKWGQETLDNAQPYFDSIKNNFDEIKTHEETLSSTPMSLEIDGETISNLEGLKGVQEELNYQITVAKSKLDEYNDSLQAERNALALVEDEISKLSSMRFEMETPFSRVIQAQEQVIRGQKLQEMGIVDVQKFIQDALNKTGDSYDGVVDSIDKVTEATAKSQDVFKAWRETIHEQIRALITESEDLGKDTTQAVMQNMTLYLSASQIAGTTTGGQTESEMQLDRLKLAQEYYFGNMHDQVSLAIQDEDDRVNGVKDNSSQIISALQDEWNNRELLNDSIKDAQALYNAQNIAVGNLQKQHSANALAIATEERQIRILNNALDATLQRLIQIAEKGHIVIDISQKGLTGKYTGAGGKYEDLANQVAGMNNTADALAAMNKAITLPVSGGGSGGSVTVIPNGTGKNYADLGGGTDPTKWHDFIMRPGQEATTFNSEDTIVGFKGSAPIGTDVTIGNITINGVSGNPSDFAYALAKELQKELRTI